MMDERELSRRLHGLVAHPPAGRNLMPAIHKASGRRKARFAAVGSGLGVATVVAGGAGLAGVFSDSRTTVAGGVGTATASAPPALSPSASAPAATAPAPTVAPPASVSAVPAPSAVPSASAAPTTTTAAAPEYWYQRTINEQYGIRSVRRAWVDQNGTITFEQPSGSDPKPIRRTMAWTPPTVTGVPVSWSDFASTPSAAQLRAWMFETPAESVKHFGHDLTGTPRANEYAFDAGMALLLETPASPAFRLAVIDAVEQIPGVTVTTSVTDEVGRTGTQLSLHSAPDVGDPTSTEQNIIDPVDGRLLQGALVDTTACPAGSLIWRAVYLESGLVPDNKTVLPQGVAAPTGQPANCAVAGDRVPPGSTVTTLPAAP